MTTDLTAYRAKQTHRALTTFGLDLASIRDGYAGGHFDANATAAEFRAACIEAGRRLQAIETLGAA